MAQLSVRRTAGLVSAALAASVVMTQAPALAATRATSHVKATAAPATVRVSGTVAVTGSVSPKVVTNVMLERFVGKAWTTVGHGKTSKTGVYALSLHAPKKAAALILRVVEGATATSKAAVSSTLHLRAVATGFAVTAAHSATGQTVTVAGKVSPKGKGSVSLDRDVSGKWVSLGKATLRSSSTYSFRKTLAAGSYKLRVSKPFTTTIASGVSPAFTAVVATAATTPPVVTPTTPAVGLPVVSTTTLTGVTLGTAYTSTLVASSGTAPYTWGLASGSLPPGLTLSTAGVVSGTPTAVSTYSFTVGVTDALGHTATGSITAVVHAVAVRSWGYDADGEYGDNTMSSTLTIATAITPGTTKSIVGGNDFALALQSDGTVYAWGLNDHGQLGVGDTTNRTAPVLIPSLTHVTAIAAGTDASYAVTSSGALYTWGNDGGGQLGDGTHGSTPVMTPTAISLTNVVAVAAGMDFAIALTGTDVVYGWGQGANGVIGDGNNTPEVDTPVAATLSKPAGVSVVALSAGTAASFALLSNGTVMSWGRQEHGQLGHAVTSTFQPTPATIAGLTGVTAIACTGFEFCLAAHSNRSVSVWGYGNDGEMGNGSTTDGLTPATVTGLTDITAVATARSTAFVLHADGTVSSWGLNSTNETGNGDAAHANTSSPAKIAGLTGVVGLGGAVANGFALQAE